MKINEAKDYDKRGIVMVADGMFQLLSFQEGSRKVYLCHTETTQIYQVGYSWLDSAYPCKHIFAIMQQYLTGILELPSAI